MADIVITQATAAKVVYQETHPAGVAIVMGQMVQPDPTTGKLKLAAAGSAGAAANAGMALASGNAGQPITVLYQGIVDVGVAPLGSLAFNVPIYLSNTAGAIADAAGTVSKQVGTVIPAWAGAVSPGTPDRLLRINLP